MSDSAMAAQPMPANNNAAPYGFFIASGALYMALNATNTEAIWMAALKIAPIVTLIWLAATRLGGLTRTLALVALGFSATGDVLLAIDFPDHFLFGLGAFLLAQLTYAGNFLRAPRIATRRFALRGTAVVVAALLLGRQVLPGAGELALPIAFYIVAIVTMALAAAAHRSGSSLLFAGAVAFMLSDALIAIDRFVDPVPLAGTWIMLTYYAAQALLIIGLIRTNLAQREA